MSVAPKGLVDEIKENAGRERESLEKMCDGITKLSEDPSVAAEPMARIGLAENISRLSEALTRSNAQLVELAKIEAKKALFERRPAGSFNERDRDDLYD